VKGYQTIHTVSAFDQVSWKPLSDYLLSSTPTSTETKTRLNATLSYFIPSFIFQEVVGDFIVRIIETVKYPMIMTKPVLAIMVPLTKI